MLVSLARTRSLKELDAHPMQVNAYDKFMAGYDTLQLAERYRVKEATMLRWISTERSRRHEIASPYEARS